MIGRRCLSGAAAVVLVFTAWSAPEAIGPQAPASNPSPVPTADYRSVLNQYCVTCHNERTKSGGMVLDKADLANVPANAEVWEKVVRKLRAGMMPPPGAPKPGDGTRAAMVGWLEGTLDRAALASPSPGRPLVHRLNRAEYANAIRDLLTLDVDTTTLLPPDDSSSGFDNIADVLGVSPVLLESYLSAAGRISALAIGDLKAPAMGEVYRVRQDASQTQHVEGLPLGTVGGFLLQRTLPLDGEYVFQVRLFRTNLGTMRGLEYPHQLEISIDGQRIHIASFGGDAEVARSSENPTTTGDEIDARFTVRVPLKAGPHSIAVAFLEKTDAKNTRRLQSYVRSSADTIDFSGYPHIDQFILTGPFNPTGVGDTPSRRRLFVCRPRGPADEGACARRVLTTVARRAYRGDLTDEDVQILLDFYQRGRQEQGSFDGGIDLALRRVLASPKFVFRVEHDPEQLAPGSVYRLTDLELASRLSFFLWSSIPDDELLQVAGQGRLTRPATLEQQVRRMLADPKSDALIGNFAAQWLHLRNLKNKVPNSHQFPDFDDDLRQALLREAELFFESVIHEDRNVVELMTADYTFVNERLARHYGISGVYGSHFRRVTLAEDARRGLLGKGAVLMVTSHAHRTSPVLRGKWILDNIVGASPPAPPENVPPLNDDAFSDKPRSVREILEQHRANPACAGCHRIMDPLGFALENFDAVGAWRVRDGGTLGTPVDASGQLIDGTQVDGAVALRNALLRQPETFVRTLTEKLLTYALGRGLTASDMPAVRGIVRDSAGQDYRFSALVLGLVNSTPFRMRVKGSEHDAPQVTARARQ